MKFRHRYKALLAIGFSVASIGLANAANLPLYIGSDCTALNGNWNPAAVGSGALGTCSLPSGFVVPAGDTLEIGSGVILDVNARDLNIDGAVNIHDDGTLQSSGNGIIRINGTVYLDNKADLIVDKAWLSNAGTIRAEGDITNKGRNGTTMTWAFYNRGLIHLFSGGHFINHGEFIDMEPEHVSENPNSVLVDLEATFSNKKGGRASARRFMIHGDFINEYGADFRTRQDVILSGQGQFNNAGSLHLWSNPGRFDIQPGGNLTSVFGSTIVNDGATLVVGGKLLLNSAALHNRNDPNFGFGTIEIGAGGLLHVSGKGFLGNSNNAIINNLGSILLGCFVFYANNGILQGNAVGRSLCYDPSKFKQPPVINWP